MTMVHRGNTWHHRSGSCGKPAKGHLANGDPACDIHLRVETQAAKRTQARAEWDRRKAAVNEALGIRCFGFEIDRPVSVTIEELERLAEERRG